LGIDLVARLNDEGHGFVYPDEGLASHA